MASKIPRMMRALALSRFGKPSEYGVATIPTPEISQPDELLVKVHAASINPIDVKLASGLGKLMGKPAFPYKIGYDLAGEVVAVGSAVTLFKPGDSVYSRTPEKYRGSVAEYVLSTEGTTGMKPKSLSFAEAASIPLAAQTALQGLERGDKQVPGGLKGKTVFVPAGLSGTGSFAVQLAKNCFGAGKVITTLSTAKIPKIKALMGNGSPDQTVDYTSENVKKTIGKGTVDFMFDTAGQTLSLLPIMKKGGVIVSISTLPSGRLMRQGNPDMKLWLVYMLNIVDWCFRTWTGWMGVNYSYLSLSCNTKNLNQLAEWVDEGKIKPVVGMQVKLSDIEGVRKGCQQIYDAKGGVGKFVIEID